MLGVSHETDCCLGSRSGGTLHIFVSCYQSETSGWVPAASHWVARPDTTCLSAAARVWPWQLCIDHLEGDSAVCVFFFALALIIIALAQAGAAEHQLDVSVQPNATVCVCVCGWSPLALLPSHFWLQPLSITPMTTRPRHKFPFLETPRDYETTQRFVFLHITCLQEIWVQSRKAACVWYVCAASLNWNKDLQLYFYLCWHGHHPYLSGALGFISEISQNDAQSFSYNAADTEQQLCDTYWT